MKPRAQDEHERRRAEPEGADGLAARLFAAAAPELAARRARARRRRRAVAAGLVLTLLGGLLLHLHLARQTAAHAARPVADPALAACENLIAGLELLIAHDSAARTQDPGLVALALLALARTGAREHDLALREGARQLADWLAADLEREADLIGATGAVAAQDRGLVTLALLESFARTGDGVLGAAARRGVTALARERHAPWRAAPTGAARLATSWELAALLSAQTLRLGGDLTAPIAAAHQLLAAQSAEASTLPDDGRLPAAARIAGEPERRTLNQDALARLPGSDALGEVYSSSLALLRAPSERD